MSRRVAAVILLTLTATAAAAAPPGARALKSAWLHRQIVLKQALYSIIVTRQAFGGGAMLSREGLTVVSPETGIYYEFHGHFFTGDRTVVGRDLQQVVEEVSAEHRLMPMRTNPNTGRLEPPMPVERPAQLITYAAGTILRVQKLAIAKDHVTLTFEDLRGHRAVTTLTVQWPQPLSRNFSEQPAIDRLLQTFLAPVR